MPDPRTVYVDTTEFYDSPLMRSGEWRELLSRVRRGQVVLVVSQVVVMETIRQYGKHAPALAEKARRTLGKLEAWGFDGPGLELSELDDGRVDAQVADYESQLLAALEGALAIVVPLPSTSHATLLDRDLGNRKPFDANGKGYRDALIWESLLEYVVSEEPVGPVILVSGNANDFAQPDGSLDQALTDDLARTGTHVTVEIASSIGEVLKELRATFVQEDLEFKETLNFAPPSTPEDMVAPAVESAAEDLAGTEVARHGDEALFETRLLLDDGLPTGIEHASITQSTPLPDTVAIAVYDSYEGDTYAASATVDSSIEIEGFVAKADYPLIQDDVRVQDWDWNDHTMVVSIERLVRLSFQVLVVGESIESLELEGIELLPGPEDTA